jgi:hypothetical protein
MSFALGLFGGLAAVLAYSSLMSALETWRNSSRARPGIRWYDRVLLWLGGRGWGN